MQYMKVVIGNNGSRMDEDWSWRDK